MRILLLMFVFISFSFAHKLNLFLNQEENKVFASAYFASGSFCKNCKILVKNQNKKLLEEGKTNSEGEFIITNLDDELFVEVVTKEAHKAVSSLKIDKSLLTNNINSKQIEELKLENAKLKSEIKALQKKLDQNEILKMIFALVLIGGIFFFLKKVKK